MKAGDLLFTYGTLRRGENMDLETRFHGGTAEFVREDRINARLYGLGWYPGLKTFTDDPLPFDEEMPSVFGDVFTIASASLVSHLDAYEGYPHLYNRVLVKTEAGLTVWVYTYNGSVNHHNIIPTGDWKIKTEVKA